MIYSEQLESKSAAWKVIIVWDLEQEAGEHIESFFFKNFSDVFTFVYMLTMLII